MVTVAGTSAAARIASARATASSSDAFPFARLNASVAAEGDVHAVEPRRAEPLPAALVQHEPGELDTVARLDRRRHLLRAGHLRHAVVAHEAHRLDPRQPGRREPVHELGAHGRRQRLRLVLEAVPRPDVAQGYPHGQSVVAPDATRRARAYRDRGASVRLIQRRHPRAHRRPARRVRAPGGGDRRSGRLARSDRSRPRREGDEDPRRHRPRRRRAPPPPDRRRRPRGRGRRGRARLRPHLPAPSRREDRDAAAHPDQDARGPLDGVHPGRRPRLARDRGRPGEDLEPHDQAQHRRGRERRHRRPRARRHRARRGACR